MTSHEDRLITKTGLKARGWSEGLITRFLGGATEERRNPRNPKGPPLKFYDRATALAIEGQTDFQSAKAGARARNQTLQAAGRRRRAKTLSWAGELPAPEIPHHSAARLRELAVSHYNAFWHGRSRLAKVANGGEPVEFINRIAVHYLRHELSGYEERLLQGSDGLDAAEARRALRQQVLTAIAAAYPELAQACEHACRDDY